MCQKYFAFILCLSFLSAVRAQVNCVTCDASNTDCITNPSAITAAVCTTNTCYTQIVAGAVTRGCTEALGSATCTGSSCVTCTTSNCNALQTICQSCNSASDTTCAQLSATNNNLNTICPTASAQCYVGITGANTERRCALTTDTCTEDSTTCRLCTGSNCNNFAFPATTTAPTPAGTGTTPAVTATTAPGSGTTAAGSGTTAPGSGTTAAGSGTTAAGSGTTAAGSGTTAAGSGTTAAGTVAPTVAPINCIVCSSSDNTACLGTPDTITGTTCAGGVCFQAWSDNVYHRGCLSTADSTLGTLCNGNSEQCKTCNTDLCNKDVVNGAATTQLTLGLIMSVALLAGRNLL